VLLLRECKALRWYVSRRMYQVALAAGGPRFDLDGHVAGEVTPDEAAHAKAAVAGIEAKRARQAKAAAANRTAQKAARRPKGPAPYHHHQATPQKTAPRRPQEPAPVPRRLGLADLKAAYAARQRGEAASHGGSPTRPSPDEQPPCERR
jgi:sRNA-binding protein